MITKLLYFFITFSTIVASATAGTVIWTNFGDDTINAADTDGTNISTIASNVVEPFAVASSTTHLYWADSDRKVIQRANLDGSGVSDFLIYTTFSTIGRGYENWST